jgi:hypothetical protein
LVLFVPIHREQKEQKNYSHKFYVFLLPPNRQDYKKNHPGAADRGRAALIPFFCTSKRKNKQGYLHHAINGK